MFDNPAYMKLYAIVYNLCTKNRLDVDNESSPQATEILYQRYGELLKKYLEERRTWEEGPAFLPTLVKRWTNHKLIVQTMEKLFAYLDRYYTKHNALDRCAEPRFPCPLLALCKERGFSEVKLAQGWGGWVSGPPCAPACIWYGSFCQGGLVGGTMGGTQLQPLTPTPPPLKMDKMFRGSGPHLVPIWCQRRRKSCFSIWRIFTPCVCTQNDQNFMGNPNMYAKHEKIF